MKAKKKKPSAIASATIEERLRIYDPVKGRQARNRLPRGFLPKQRRQVRSEVYLQISPCSAVL